MTAIMVPIVYAAIVAIVIAMLVGLMVWVRGNRQVKEHRTLSAAVKDTRKNLEDVSAERDAAKAAFDQINSETKLLRALKANADILARFVKSAKKQATDYKATIENQKLEIDNQEKVLNDLMASLDLYSRLDEYTQVGHFDVPDYLYETSERFKVEINAVRDKQKALIHDKEAVAFPEGIEIRGEKAFDNRILKGQIRLLLASFNIKCDMLIGKVNPGNYPRTLEQIEKQANTLEKSVADLNCGFSSEYVELKMQECRLQYQFKLKKQEEQEEQRLIREQMREEERARREYEAAVRKAENEERVYQEMLDKARRELELLSDEERQAAEARIADLEAQLAEAEAQGVRAKSLAEQTRRGHVYVISNIGSFGKGIYKIGLTRRLDPLDRVKELGDASVPFVFDVHAIVYSEDAPAMEAALHRKFNDHRVNAVNMRKEFFRVELDQIRNEVETISEGEADFKTTVVAEEYFETRRLRGQPASS